MTRPTPLRILIVDDYEPFRGLISSLLQKRADFQIVGQASDGLEAIQKAEELRPDLILLDIGLPKLNGLGVAKRHGKLDPDAKILFLSQEFSPDIVREALSLGARGYIHKPRTHSDLFPAVEAVLAGEQFVSSDLEDWEPKESAATQVSDRHEVQFYSDDRFFFESFVRFISAALKTGNSTIVVVTKSHQEGLLQRLRAESVDVDGAIQKGTYISVDAADSLSEMMVDGLPDPVRFIGGISSLIEAGSIAAKAEQPRVAICGERVSLLWAEGKTDAAIRLEQLCNDLAKIHDIDILCAYPASIDSGNQGEIAYKSICAQHSAVHSR